MIVTAPILQGPQKSLLISPSFFTLSVMSRHTLSDGRTPDPRITQDLFDYHVVELAPPPKLVGGYYRGEVFWEEFEARYLEHLRQPEIVDIIWQMIDLSDAIDIVFVCIEDAPERCHRRLLVEECLRLDPYLRVEIY